MEEDNKYTFSANLCFGNNSPAVFSPVETIKVPVSPWNWNTFNLDIRVLFLFIILRLSHQSLVVTIKKNPLTTEMFCLASLQVVGHYYQYEAAMKSEDKQRDFYPSLE